MHQSWTGITMGKFNIDSRVDQSRRKPYGFLDVIFAWRKDQGNSSNGLPIHSSECAFTFQQLVFAKNGLVEPIRKCGAPPGTLPYKRV